MPISKTFTAEPTSVRNVWANHVARLHTENEYAALFKVVGVGFWTHCMRKSVRIYLGRSVTVETLLSAHISRAVLEDLAQDRNPGTDHDDSTQFILRVSQKDMR